MEQKSVSDLLAIYLVLFLAFVAFSSLFIFVINWEDWFFGIKLDGWLAGIYLFSKAVVAMLLAYLLLKSESKRIVWSILSIVFFAFVFVLPVFSSQRNLRSDLGWTIFWIELVVLIIIPFILLTIYMVMNRMNKEGSESTEKLLFP